MGNDFAWLCKAIFNKANNLNHYDSLKRLIYNFELKWKNNHTDNNKYNLYLNSLYEALELCLKH